MAGMNAVPPLMRKKARNPGLSRISHRQCVPGATNRRWKKRSASPLCFSSNPSQGQKKTAGWTRPLLPLRARETLAACLCMACVLCRDSFRQSPQGDAESACAVKGGGAKAPHGGGRPCPSVLSYTSRPVLARPRVADFFRFIR